MQIDEKLIAYLEDLSYLALSDEEKKKLASDLGGILESMARLGELNTENVPELNHPFDDVNALREDETRASYDRELILKNAPERSNAMFITPKTVE